MSQLNLYAFSPADSPIPKDVLGYPTQGVVVRANWGTINPASGRYDWSQIDRDISAAQSAGKRVILAFYTGPSTPSWIAAARFAFTWPTHPGTFTMPTPYDPAVTAAWNTFVAAAVLVMVRTRSLPPCTLPDRRCLAPNITCRPNLPGSRATPTPGT